MKPSEKFNQLQTKTINKSDKSSSLYAIVNKILGERKLKISYLTNFVDTLIKEFD